MRKSPSLSISLFIHYSNLHLLISLSINLSIYWSLLLSNSPFIDLSNYRSLLSNSPSIDLSINWYLHLSISSSIDLSFYQTLYSSIFSSIPLFISSITFPISPSINFFIYPHTTISPSIHLSSYPFSSSIFHIINCQR